MKIISGGVCAAKGFMAAGIHAGIRKNKDKKDLALIVSEVPAQAAGCYTQNLVKGAPIWVTKKHIENGIARAIVCNSGNANTCNADSIEVAEKMCQIVADNTGLMAEDVIVSSTGVIGQPLDTTPIENAMPELAKLLSADGGHDAAVAIMTTDTVPKECAVQFEIGGKPVTLGACCKGSGMIHPNMATMLCFMTTDCKISPVMLQKALSDTVKDTFNMISVDGDTSTNDMVCIMANGFAENDEITEIGADYETFKTAHKEVTVKLSRLIAGDGEGASRLITCKMTHARSEESAERLAKAVVGSSLVKAAMFGADANWGRVLCAMGYSKAPFRPEYVDVSFQSCAGEIMVCKHGEQLNFDEDKAKEILSQKEVIIAVNLNEGSHEAECWGCDLTYDYVKINGDYRT